MRSVLKAWPVLLLVAGCGGGGSGGGDAGKTPDSGTGGVSLDDAAVDGATGDGAVGGAGGAGGGGGEGGTPSTEQPIDERCPDLQAGHFLLVGFPDRVDAYELHDFTASYFCKFLDLSGNGITHASAMARGSGDNGFFLVADTREGKGELHVFDANGNHVERRTGSVNLADLGGLWPKFSGDGFVAWSKANSNLYELDADGKFVGPWTPPEGVTSRLDRLTDLLFIRADAVVTTFADRAPKIFYWPNSPELPTEEVATANAVAAVITDAGTRLLISGEVGGAGNGFGVVLYKEVLSGRAPPEKDKVLVNPGEFNDGIGLLMKDDGFLVLDSAVAGSARVIGFNTSGVLQDESALEGGGNPYRMSYEVIFPDY